MDTSEQYIKVCEKAEGIRQEWKPTAWDYIVCTLQQAGDDRVEVISGYCTDSGVYGHGIDGGDNCCYASYYTKKGDWGEFKSDHIWLPRQDQLQELVGNFEEHSELLAEYFCATSERGEYPFNSGLSAKYWLQFTSMEQLWLALMMEHNYKKQWNGEDWVKTGDQNEHNRPHNE